MFSWLINRFQKPTTRLPRSGTVDWKTVGVTPRGNPGQGGTISVAFQSQARSWEESLDLAEVLASVLKDAGLAPRLRNGEIELAGSGLRLRPQIESFQPLEAGQGTKAATTIEVSHPLFPSVFEYQYSEGATLREAVLSGFTAWMETDLTALLDTLREEPQSCTAIEIPYPDSRGGNRWRRVVLGPVTYAAKPPHGETPESSGHAPGCACCHFTHLQDLLNPLLESDSFAALRVLTVRHATGEVLADCRINGEEYEQGKECLRAYARTRPGTHFEFRKQLIIIQNWFDANDPLNRRRC